MRLDALIELITWSVCYDRLKQNALFQPFWRSRYSQKRALMQQTDAFQLWYPVFHLFAFQMSILPDAFVWILFEYKLSSDATLNRRQLKWQTLIIGGNFGFWIRLLLSHCWRPWWKTETNVFRQFLRVLSQDVGDHRGKDDLNGSGGSTDSYYYRWYPIALIFFYNKM